MSNLKEKEIGTNSVTIVSQNVQKVELSPAMQETIKEALVIYLRTNSSMVKELLAESLPAEEIELKKIPKDEAKQIIMEIINTNMGIKTSDIIEKTCLDPTLVIEILHELKTEGKVKNE